MMTRRVFQVVLTIGIACLALFWVIRGYVTPFLEVPSKPHDLAPVVADISSGRLRPDKDGIVVLPREYSSLTKFGEAYVERRKDGLVLVLFPTWDIGRGSVRGYLYHNRPLSKGDTLWMHKDHWAVAAPYGSPVARHLEVIIEREAGSH